MSSIVVSDDSMLRGMHLARNFEETASAQGWIQRQSNR